MKTKLMTTLSLFIKKSSLNTVTRLVVRQHIDNSVEHMHLSADDAFHLWLPPPIRSTGVESNRLDKWHSCDKFRRCWFIVSQPLRGNLMVKTLDWGIFVQNGVRSFANGRAPSLYHVTCFDKWQTSTQQWHDLWHFGLGGLPISNES